MTSKHPKRCETCTNDECDFNEDRWGSTWHNDIYYFMKKCGCASHSSASEPAPEPNPCEENGCTDIENCDEICEHMRIYSPAYVRASRQKARADVLDDVIKFCETEHSAPLHEETAFRVSRYAKSLRQQEGMR